MSVQKIEEYRQKNGTDILKVFCKPTSKYPEGSNYFYVDAKDIDVINNYTWFLVYYKEGCRVLAHDDDFYEKKNILLYQALATKYFSYLPDCIDHISGCTLDNTDANLNVVIDAQNCRNKPTKGYMLDKRYNFFEAHTVIDTISYYPCKITKKEVQACVDQRYVEVEFLSQRLGNDYYIYDFLKDRRGDLDIVDLERTGIVSEEEAIYKHVMRYAKDNAWYYYRYNLEQYFKDNHIPVPDFDEDEQGFMIDKITRKKLCPLWKE